MSNVPLFRNKFNKFNNTGAQLLDSIYHVALSSRIFWRENLTAWPLLRNVKLDVITQRY